MLTGVIDESQQRYSTTTYTKSLYSNNATAISTRLGTGVDTYSAVYQGLASGERYATGATITMPSGSTRQVNVALLEGVVMPTAVTTSCSGCTSIVDTYTYDSNG
jgi:hypothetical protein